MFEHELYIFKQELCKSIMVHTPFRFNGYFFKFWVRGYVLHKNIDNLTVYISKIRRPGSFDRIIALGLHLYIVSEVFWCVISLHVVVVHFLKMLVEKMLEDILGAFQDSFVEETKGNTSGEPDIEMGSRFTRSSSDVSLESFNKQVRQKAVMHMFVSLS